MQEKVIIREQGLFAVLGQDMQHGRSPLLHFFGEGVSLVIQEGNAGERHGQQNKEGNEEGQFYPDGEPQRLILCHDCENG